MNDLGVDENGSMARLAEGDDRAFVELYRSTQPRIYRYALQMTGSVSSAEEAVQEVFMTLIQNPKKYDETRGTVGAYLFGVARNVVKRLLEHRRSSQWCATPEQEQGNHSVVEQETPYSQISRTELVGKVREAILQLPEPYREIIVLCELLEMSYSDAAKIVRCRTGTVRSRLHRGRALLSQKLRNGAAREFSCRTEQVVRGLS